MTVCPSNYKKLREPALATDRPPDDKVVGRGAASLHVLRVFLGARLGRGAHLRVP